MTATNQPSHLLIGWSQQSITPDRPVLLAGQFHARISEGVKDPVTVTAMAIDNGQDHVIFISCDIVGIPEQAIVELKKQLADLPGFDPEKVVINATHSHAAPDGRPSDFNRGFTSGVEAIGLGPDLMKPEEYFTFFVAQIVQAAREAWTRRAPGSLAYGMTHAVIGRNRRWVNMEGVSSMYGNTAVPGFSHIEGYEDPTVNILAAWDEKSQLTGVLLNVACPSQVSEQDWTISADYWHDTREEIRRRHGQHVYILGQCSAAGDQSPHTIWGKAAEERMLKLKGRTKRQEIAHRLAGAVDEVLPVIKPVARSRMIVRHIAAEVELPLNNLSQKDVDDALADAEKFKALYEAEKARIEADPSIRQQPRWYKEVTRLHRSMTWKQSVAARYQRQQSGVTTCSVPVHVVRLDDMVLASNPFEYYLDFGLRIKARSPFEQTFLVQLCGRGTYLAPYRSITGGGYGSIPANNVVGPEGGSLLCEKTLEFIHELRH